MTMKTQDAPPAPPSSNTGGKSARRATPVEQALVDRFRAVLAGKGETEQQTAGLTEEDAAAPLPDSETPEHKSSELETRGHVQTNTDSAMDMDTLVPITVGTLAAHSPNQAASAAATATSMAPAYNPAAVAQLLEKHVRQLLVSEPRSARGDTPQVMLNLTDAALPGTKITLTQTQAGWKLASSSTSTASYRVIQELAPQLQSRFAERGLGDLDLQVSLEEPDG